MDKVYKIGTRGSLLALTQCHQVKNELEHLMGLKFELVILKTQGDIITNAPLWQLEGKDFFTKELDHALLGGQTDLTVHSYKDLGSERPDNLKIAAVTKRKFSHDILLFKKDLDFSKILKSKEKLIVGTSSPRRIHNLKNYLSELLPFNPTIETKFLRGNVNTRIEKLLQADYHAIALALPGIERLAQGQEDVNTAHTQNEFYHLIKDLNFILLPTTVLPPAAAQGALAIEINANRHDNGELESYLKKIHCTETYEVIKKERASFVSYGGGCHLACGIHAQKIPSGIIEVHRGVDNDNHAIDKTIFTPNDDGQNIKYLLPKIQKSFFFGMNENHEFSQMIKNKLPHTIFDEITLKTPLNIQANLEATTLFVTSPHTLKNISNIKAKFIFTAGIKTWKKLNQKGILVNGAGDFMGEKEIKHFLNSHFYQMISGTKYHSQESKTYVLTHEHGKSSIGDIIPTYKRELKKPSFEFIEKLKHTDVFYWGSPIQFDDYCKTFSDIFKTNRNQIHQKIHLVGPGKTYKKFRSLNIPCTVIPNLEYLQKIIMEKI